MTYRFNQRFNEARRRPPYEAVKMKLESMKTRRDIDYFCLVEGSSDTPFYSNIRHPFFESNSVKPIPMENGDGKEGVLKTAEFIRKKMPDYKDKVIFIIDHDNFNDQELSMIDDSYVQKKTTVLPVYSFENFFVVDGNVEVIMSYLSDSERKDFIECFQEFCDLIIPFYACKRVLTACKSLEEYKKFHNVRHKKTFLEKEDIFRFYFDEKPFFQVDLMESEIRDMKSTFWGRKELEILYADSLKYLSSSIGNIKGKFLLEFIKEYFRQVVHRNIGTNGEYRRMIRELDVRFEVKV